MERKVLCQNSSHHKICSVPSESARQCDRACLWSLPKRWNPLFHRHNSGTFRKLHIWRGEVKVGWRALWVLAEGVGPGCCTQSHGWRQTLTSLPLRLEQAHRKLPFAAVQTVLAELQHAHCSLQLFQIHSFIGHIQREIKKPVCFPVGPFSIKIKLKWSLKFKRNALPVYALEFPCSFLLSLIRAGWPAEDFSSSVS